MFEFVNSISGEKETLKVVIFGPYREGGYDRLVRLRDSLRDVGYKETELVEQLPDPLEVAGLEEFVYETKKSEYWVRLCDVGLYVFFQGISHASVAIEIKELVDHAPDRVPCSSFFVQDIDDLDTLVRGTIELTKRDIGQFDTDEDLYALAEKACLHHIVEDDCKQLV